MSEKDQPNTQGVADENPDADTASGGAPDQPDESQSDAGERSESDS